jgi:predicted O-methyltransferase YrrM
MSNYQKIFTFEDGPVQYENSGKNNIKMKQHPFPYSIKEEEFNFITDTIVKYDLKRGYECATAFGVSTMACALGFKQTGGKMVTMDAYIEEDTKHPEAYKDQEEKRTYADADGYKSVMYLREKFGVQDNLECEVGWSPDDTEKTIRKHFGDEKIDFVFLDAGHFPEQIIKDIDSFVPFLAEKFVVLFHDDYTWSFTQDVHNHIRNVFGCNTEIFIPHPRGENLSGIIKV